MVTVVNKTVCATASLVPSSGDVALLQPRALSGAAPTVYLYDGASLGANAIEAMDNNANVVVRYTQGPGIDQPFAEIRSSTTSYYEQDGLGSVSSLSNPSAVLANTYTYDTFGNLTSSSGTLVNPLQYAGREFDPETGDHYNRLRYLNPNIGRFISEDRIEFQGGINFYSYTRNNPVILTDPLGKSAWSWLEWLNFVGWFQCRYYMGQCAQAGLACKQNCSAGDWQDTMNRLAEQNTPYEGTANYKQCFQGAPACQKMIESCGGVPMGFTGFPPLR